MWEWPPIKPSLYMNIKTEIYLYLQSTKRSPAFKNTILKFEEFFPCPIFAKKGKIYFKTNFRIFWQ